MLGRPRHSSPRDFRLAEPMAAPRAPDIIVRRQPTRETSLVVSRKSPRERARCPCAPRRRRSARRRAAAFVLTRVGGAKDQARDGRNLGPPTSAADRRRWPDPCKGWPSATASGGFGLDKRPASDIFAPPRFRRAGAGLERTPDAPPGARHHANFPLDKKDLIQGRVRARGIGRAVDRLSRLHGRPED